MVALEDPEVLCLPRVFAGPSRKIEPTTQPLGILRGLLRQAAEDGPDFRAAGVEGSTHLGRDRWRAGLLGHPQSYAEMTVGQTPFAGSVRASRGYAKQARNDPNVYGIHKAPEAYTRQGLSL